MSIIREKTVPQTGKWKFGGESSYPAPNLKEGVFLGMGSFMVYARILLPSGEMIRGNQV